MNKCRNLQKRPKSQKDSFLRSKIGQKAKKIHLYGPKRPKCKSFIFTAQKSLKDSFLWSKKAKKPKSFIFTAQEGQKAKKIHLYGLGKSRSNHIKNLSRINDFPSATSYRRKAFGRPTFGRHN